MKLPPSIQAAAERARARRTAYDTYAARKGAESMVILAEAPGNHPTPHRQPQQWSEDPIGWEPPLIDPKVFRITPPYLVSMHAVPIDGVTHLRRSIPEVLRGIPRLVRMISEGTGIVKRGVEGYLPAPYATVSRVYSPDARASEIAKREALKAEGEAKRAAQKVACAEDRATKATRREEDRAAKALERWREGEIHRAFSNFGKALAQVGKHLDEEQARAARVGAFREAEEAAAERAQYRGEIAEAIQRASGVVVIPRTEISLF